MTTESVFFLTLLVTTNGMCFAVDPRLIRRWIQIDFVLRSNDAKTFDQVSLKSRERNFLLFVKSCELVQSNRHAVANGNVHGLNLIV